MLRLLRLSLLLAFILAACAPTSTPAPTDPPALPTVPPTPAATPTTEPTSAIIPSATPTTAQLSFEPATYQDEGAGFELDYPSSWTADPPLVGGDRGYFAQITSWSRTPGELPETVPAGESVLSITVLLWDPKNALDAFVDVRKEGWASSGFEILSEEERTLTGDWRALQFLIRSPEDESLFLVTTVGERYLVLSGSGDLDLLVEIAGTLRPLTLAP